MKQLMKINNSLYWIKYFYVWINLKLEFAKKNKKKYLKIYKNK